MNRRSLSVGGCSWRWIPLLVITSLVSGCSHEDGPSRGGGGGPDGGAAAVVTRVEASPGALLLARPGQTQTLTARAFDAQGKEITTSFTWSSTRPAEVTVDSAGRVSAAALGSAQVTAAAGGVTSAAVTVLVAETLPGTVLVGDAQVVSVGPVTLVQDGGPGTRYEVRLRGISLVPAAGTILLASESAQVAGKVVSTRDESGTLVATLELRPLHELLGRYHIDWDLEVGPYAEDDALAQVTAPGSAPAALRQRSAAAVLRPFTAASCAFDFEASLFKKTISLSPSSSLRWMVVETRDDPNQGPTYVKHALIGEFSLTGSVEVGLNAELSVSGTCLAQLPPIRIAAFGAVSVLIMPAVRLGVGIELSGALHIATGTVGISGKVGVQPEIGWECGPAPLPCRGLANLSEIREVTPKLEAPSIHGMKVELHGQVFALVGLDLAVLGGLGGYFGIAEARIGPKQSATLAFEDDQAHEPGSSSSYDLKLSGSIGPGPGLSAAIKKVIDDDSVSVDLRFRKDVSLSESPKGTLTVDKEKAGINEQVKLTVDITPAQTASYVGIGYNVVSIQIFRKKPGEDVFERDQDLEIVPSAVQPDALREGLETEGSRRGQERARRLRAHRGARHGDLAAAGDRGRLAQAGGGAGDLSVRPAFRARGALPRGPAAAGRGLHGERDAPARRHDRHRGGEHDIDRTRKREVRPGRDQLLGLADRLSAGPIEHLLGRDRWHTGRVHCPRHLDHVHLHH